jgi:hypothetical protein
MSSQARYFLRMWFGVLARLEQPGRSPVFDRQLFEDEHRVRLLAADLIGWGVSPENVPDCIGLQADASGRFSVTPAPNFCQAGVVAPPDSPGFGKTVAEC